MAATKTTKKAAIAETEAGQKLQALLEQAGALSLEDLVTEDGGINPAALNALLKSQGLKAVATGVAETKYSRVAKREKWMTAKALDEDEKALVAKLPEVIGSAVTFTDEESIRDITQDEIDTITSELLVRREVEDILKGRYEALRATVLDVVTLRNDDDPYATGQLTSLKHGQKLVVGKQERGGEPDYTQLESVVGEDIWKEITDEVVTVTRTVNEEKLVQALTEGKIPMEQYASIIPSKNIVRTLTVRPLKKGDEVE